MGGGRQMVSLPVTTLMYWSFLCLNNLSFSLSI